MIVWVASYPRSGNSFFRAVLWESFGQVKSGSVYSQRSESYASSKGFGFHVSPDSLDDLRAISEPVFVKTHRLADPGDDSPVVYLVRDGRDAVTSYARFAVLNGAPGFEDRTFEEATEALIARRDDEIGGWSANVRSWTRRDAPTAIVRFEELIEDPLATIRAGVESLGISLPETSGPPPSFDQLREEDPVLFPRGEVGAWKSEMPDRLLRLFWRLHGAEMLVMGYSPLSSGSVRRGRACAGRHGGEGIRAARG
jgi:hypothetical protein